MSGDSPAKNGECLSDEVLTDYLEGTLSPVTRSACEAHLISCDTCRRNLALFMRVLRDDLAPEEEVAVKKLAEICTPGTIQPIAADSTRLGSRTVRRLVYALGAIAAVTILAVLTGYFPFHSSRPTGEIAKALLAEIRPFEPRIAGQPYRVAEETTRSPAETAKFNALTEKAAEQLAVYELGQLFLIQKQYADAIKYLRQAAQDTSATADVHNDLGVAYLQSGEETFGLAEKEFKAALKQDPNHASAVFNLSILYEREGLSGEAEAMWHQYLQMDPDSGWAREIKQKLRREGTAKQ